jgi:hypothetical protein
MRKYFYKSVGYYIHGFFVTVDIPEHQFGCKPAKPVIEQVLTHAVHFDTALYHISNVFQNLSVRPTGKNPDASINRKYYIIEIRGIKKWVAKKMQKN